MTWMRRWFSGVAMAALVLGGLALPAFGEFNYFNLTTDGNWMTAGNWSTGLLPNASTTTAVVGDNVTSSTARTVRIVSGEIAVCNYLQVGPTFNGTANCTVEMGGDNLTATLGEQIGNGGTGTFHQTAGTNTTPYAYLPPNVAGGQGTYNLDNGTLNCTSTNHPLRIGFYGSASNVFNQTGGSVTYPGGTAPSIYLGGSASGATGTYNMSGGTLTVPTMDIKANGTFKLSGGTANLFKLWVGTAASTTLTSTVEVSGGTLYVNNVDNSTLDPLRVGYGSNGIFTQTGGTVQTRTLGVPLTGTGTYNMQGGTLHVVGPHDGSYSFYIGRYYTTGTTGQTTGAFNQTGGTVTIDKNAILCGTTAAGLSSGTITISGGTFNAPTSTIDLKNSSLFKVIGGTATIKLSSIINDNLSNATPFEFDFDATGISTIVSTGNDNLTGRTILVKDDSNTAPLGIFTLIQGNYIFGPVTVTLPPGTWSSGLSSDNKTLWVQHGTLVATPVFDTDNTSYMYSDSPHTIHVSCATTGAEIRYTINGGDPTTTDSLYDNTTGISISNAQPTWSIRAKAFKTGLIPSLVATANYTFVSYTSADLSDLLASLDAQSGDPNWNSGTWDLDHDGEVTSSDLAILLNNMP